MWQWIFLIHQYFLLFCCAKVTCLQTSKATEVWARSSTPFTQTVMWSHICIHINIKDPLGQCKRSLFTVRLHMNVSFFPHSTYCLLLNRCCVFLFPTCWHYCKLLTNDFLFSKNMFLLKRLSLFCPNTCFFFFQGVSFKLQCLIVYLYLCWSKKTNTCWIWLTLWGQNAGIKNVLHVF